MPAKRKVEDVALIDERLLLACKALCGEEPTAKCPALCWVYTVNRNVEYHRGFGLQSLGQLKGYLSYLKEARFFAEAQRRIWKSMIFPYPECVVNKCVTPWCLRVGDGKPLDIRNLKEYYSRKQREEKERIGEVQDGSEA